MAEFVEKVRDHFRRHSTQRTHFEDALLNSIKEAASASAALANAAMIVAQGCPKRYVETLVTLYTANKLPCPDLSVLFDQHVTYSPESVCHSAPEESQESSVQCILRHIEDVEELPASVDEVIEILSEFDTFEESTHLFVTNDSLPKTDVPQLPFDVFHSVVNDSLPGTNEQDMLEGWFDEDLSIHDLSLPIADDSVSFGKSSFRLTFSDPILNSSMISPITTKRITFSTQADSSHELNMITPGKTKHSVVKFSDFSPIKRASSSTMPTTKSISSYSLATSTPVCERKSRNMRTTKSTTVGARKSLNMGTTKSTTVGARKSLNMGTTKSTTVGVRKSMNSHRTQSSIVESDDGESFMIISLKETSTGLENVGNRHIRNRKPHIKRNWLMNYIV